MSDKPILVDAYCGGGGATRGYQLAGFYVIGVDKDPQPHYCGDLFIQADALEFLEFPGRFVWPPGGTVAAIHASPPCKAFTKTGWAYKYDYHANHDDLLTPTRALLEATGKPWVIENVPGSPMRADVVLCGSQFGLGVRRHRWFEFSEPPFQLMPPCVHPEHVVTPLGNPNAARGSRREWAEAMDIDWMTTAGELSQAIPPAYTEWVGARLMEQPKVSTDA